MSPMCMYSCPEQDGIANSWHFTHYTSRAVGQVGLIFVEATAVTPQGRISMEDLGIWDDTHVEGLRHLVNLIHEQDAKIGIQLAHAGRKARIDGSIIAPSSIPFDEKSDQPVEMTSEDIKDTIEAFRQGARRAREAGFDVIEIHGAHGYLINEFLSPLSNKREDEYGGSKEKRYRFLEEIIEAVKEEWNGPLFVRISAHDYHPDGYTSEDYVNYTQRMKEQGVDLIDCSSGGVVNAPINVYPGYQVNFAELIRKKGGVPTGAVGLITEPMMAEEILQNNRADMIFLARALLKDPYWPRNAAEQLGTQIEPPVQYNRGW
jgi:NADPH2 dehydrogenase